MAHTVLHKQVSSEVEQLDLLEQTRVWGWVLENHLDCHLADTIQCSVSCASSMSLVCAVWGGTPLWGTHPRSVQVCAQHAEAMRLCAGNYSGSPVAHYEHMQSKAEISSTSSRLANLIQSVKKLDSINRANLFLFAVEGIKSSAAAPFLTEASSKNSSPKWCNAIASVTRAGNPILESTYCIHLYTINLKCSV